MLLIVTPLMVTLVVFHELIYVPRLVDCQQKLPAPSKVKGAVMVDVTGEQAPTLGVIVIVGEAMRVAVMADVTVMVGVRVGVLLTAGVRVRVKVAVEVRVRTV